MEQLNYYEILEITENASQEVIKAAYRALAKKYHPDSFKGSNSEREKNMSQINEAYDVLSDEQKRRNYNQKLKYSSEKSYRNDETENRRQSQTEYNQSTDGNYEKQQEEPFYNYENYDDEMTDDNYSTDDSNASKFGKNVGKFFSAVGKEIMKDMQKNSKYMENAYLEGIEMDDYTLVRRFKNATGYKRVGYSKALEEKGLLERNYDGKLIPTCRFKKIF